MTARVHLLFGVAYRRLFTPGFRPRTTGSFLCVPKERNRKKRHPGLCAPHVNLTCGIPSLVGRLRGFAQGTGPCAWGERGGSFPRRFVLALRSPSSLGLSKGDPKRNQSHLNRRLRGSKKSGVWFGVFGRLSPSQAPREAKSGPERARKGFRASAAGTGMTLRRTP